MVGITALCVFIREQAILAHDPSKEELAIESQHVNTGRLFDGITPMLVSGSWGWY